jgi:hypothetical protein
MGFSHIKFGRIVPKDRSYEDKYCFKKMMAVPTKKVEKNLLVPLSLRSFYDQGELGACVGYSCSWMMSIYNCLPKQQKYDAVWLYRQAQINDGFPETNPPNDTGTVVSAGFWVLNHLGHKKINENQPDINDGIMSYYWGQSSDDIRTAIAIGRPAVIGVSWFQEFMTPKRKNGEYWIGTSKNIGKSLGGHAIVVTAASDKRQAVKLQNSWGLSYPQVWLPYSMLDKLMVQDGEMCIAIDAPTSS